jgi:hypothetical protein
MVKNHSTIEHLLILVNKEMGHVGSGIVIEDKKIEEKNFSEIKGFIHEEELDKYMEAAPSKPVVSEELQNIGVTAVSNPAFPEHIPILDTKPITPIEEQINVDLQLQLKEKLKKKDSSKSGSWLDMFNWKKFQQESSDKQAA